MTERQPGDDLREYIKSARQMLSLTPPSYDGWRATDDAFTSLAGLRALLDYATERLTELGSSTFETYIPDHAAGERFAFVQMLAIVEDAIEEHLAHFEE